jgi:hypothetical protein
MMEGPPSGKKYVVASAVLQELHECAPKDHFTLAWVLSHLDSQSFGLVLFLLGIAAIVPGICTFAGLLLVISAAQMVVGRSAPFFPRWIAVRPLSSRHLDGVVIRTITALRLIEKVIYPRWPMPAELTKRVVGFAVMILSVRLLVVPLPLSNIVPALVIALIALAYLEDDRLSLLIALIAGLAILVIDLEVARKIIHWANPGSLLGAAHVATVELGGFSARLC